MLFHNSVLDRSSNVQVLCRVTLVLTPVSPLLCGLDPRLALSQFGHDIRTTAEGLPQDPIRAIVQSGDGCTWFTTAAGASATPPKLPIASWWSERLECTKR
jgi:ligand-binding sensor domain-containing protein